MEKDADGSRPVSDRTFKTHIYSDAELQRIANMDPEDVNLKTLEIAFDRTCLHVVIVILHLVQHG